MDCGVAGICLKKPLRAYSEEGGAVFQMYRMLTALQHRGQQTAGFTSFNFEREQDPLDTHTGQGLVGEVFNATNSEEFRCLMRIYAGTAAIGHVRYVTSGDNNGNGEMQRRRLEKEAQPFHRPHGHVRKHFALAFNGNLANFPELRADFESQGEYRLSRRIDTEALVYVLAININHELENAKAQSREYSLKQALSSAATRLDGSYSVGVLNLAGDLIAFRDPHGFMPLCWGENDKFIAFASETKALNMIGIFEHRDIAPGEYLLIDRNKKLQRGRFAEATPTPCFFQLMYFADQMSKTDGVVVKDFREQIGKELARLEPLRDALNPENWVVLPVPETSIVIGKKMAEELGIPCSDALKKVTGIRAFIEKEEQRSNILAVKYNIDPADLKDKNLIVVDDSIVRGKTSKMLIRYIRESARPRSIHFRSACPPIGSPCFYGVDFPTFQELVAVGYNKEEVNNLVALKLDLQVDSLRYLPLASLDRILQEFGHARACKACLTGEYPTPAGTRRLEEILAGSK